MVRKRPSRHIRRVRTKMGRKKVLINPGIKHFAKKKNILTVHTIWYVPSTINVDQQISKSEMTARVKEVVNYLTRKFGGTTRIKGLGTYEKELTKEIVTDKVVKVESFTDRASYKKNYKEVRRWFGKKVKEWGQESLAVEVEEDIGFIYE